MKGLLKISALAAMICCTAFSQTTIRHVRLNSPVDTNTIAVAYNLISNAVAVASRLGILDQESLARAVQIGQDLSLIQTSTNGWALAVDNIVEVDQAHVPGVLFVGDTIYGAPSTEKGRIDLTGCDFYYDRQIPGDPSGTNGWGNIVTDPYMDWRLSLFYSQFWDAVAAASDLPASIAADLQAYSSATGRLANVSAEIVAAKSAALSDISAVRDEVNATNSVIRASITAALAQAEGGASWTQRTVSGTAVQDTADHETVYCTYSGNGGVTVAFPTPTGASRFNIVFANAPDLYENGSSISWAIPAGATVYYSGDISTVFDDWYWECRDLCVFEVAEVANNVWSIRKSGYWRYLE